MRLAIAVALLTAAATPAFAQSGTPGIDHRQARQEHRIDRGLATGTLSPREARRLDHGQARVHRMENRAKADGFVTRRERARLHHAQDRQSRRIWRQTHDRNGS